MLPTFRRLSIAAALTVSACASSDRASFLGADLSSNEADPLRSDASADAPWVPDAAPPPAADWGARARAVADDLVARAETTPDGLRWSVTDFFAPDGGLQKAYPIDLYEGSLGIVWFLSEASRALHDAHARDAAVAGAKYVAAHASDFPDNGLFTGLAGAGWVYCSLFEATGDAAWRARAVAVGEAIAAEDSAGLDVISGSAGEGLFFLRLHDVTSDPRWLAAAARRAAWLERNATADHGEKWPSYVGDTDFYPGFAHGTAGVGYFLARLARVEGKAGAHHLALAESAAKYLRSIAVARPQGYDWYFAAPSQTGEFAVQWCHGAAGIGMFFAELHRASGDAADLSMATACAEAVLDRGASWNVELCHGLGGNTELLLALHDDTHQAAWRNLSEQRGADIWKARDCANGCTPRWPSADGTGDENPGLMTGAAGVGAFFLELAATGPRTSPLMP